MDRGATISDCGRYRYDLWRSTGLRGTKTVLFVMLNPSTADAEEDDPTIRRCLGFARAQGAARLVVVNLFPFRATKPADLWRAEDLRGPGDGADNRAAIVLRALESDLVIAAWGAGVPARHREAVTEAITMVTHVAQRDLYALVLTAAGHPSHPLYLPNASEPFVWQFAWRP